MIYLKFNALFKFSLTLLFLEDLKFVAELKTVLCEREVNFQVVLFFVRASYNRCVRQDVHLLMQY